jgi:hypothetical protein
MKNPATRPSGNIIAAHRRLVLLIAVPVLLLLFAGGLWTTLGGNLFRGTTPVVAVADWGAEEGAPPMARTAGPGEPALGQAVTIRAVGLMAGTSVEVRGSDTQQIPSRFTARYGEVDTQAGIYTVPEFMPPSGIDYVTVRVDGKEQEFTVRVLPNPEIPGSDEGRLIRVSQGFFSDEPMTTPFDIGTVLSTEQTLPVVLLEEGQVYEAPLPITSSEALEDMGAGWLRLPSTILSPPEQGGSDGKLALRPTDPNLSEGLLVFLTAIRYWDMVQPPPSGCQDGAYQYGEFENVGGLVKNGWTQNTGNFIVNAGIGAQIAASGFSVEVGVSYPYSITSWEVVQNIERDVYKCVDGMWTFIGREKCERTGVLMSLNPKWMCVVMMTPCDGSPDFLPHLFNCSTPE